jgi:hypothetical protein
MRTQVFGILVSLLAGSLSMLFATAKTAPEKAATSHLAPWVFRADWTGGYCGWMSFPLAQDVGYDPSLYTEKEGNHTVLVHNFVSHGERRAWFGLIRPLKFSAGPQASFEISYRLQISGTIKGLTLILAAANGHQYSAVLPSGNGEHTVRIRGAQLGLTTATRIEAVLLRGLLQHPPVAIESRWVLEHFAVHAVRPMEVALVLPQLDTSLDSGWVAREVVSAGSPLRVEPRSNTDAARVSVYDGAGHLKTTINVRAGERQLSIPIAAEAAPGLWRCEITQGGARTSFRFLVLGPLPAHPRLLLSQDRLDQLGSASKYAELRQQIHVRAQSLASSLAYNAAAGDNLDLMPSGPGIEPATQGELKPYFELLEKYSNAVAYNALDYRLNGNLDALKSARRALLTMAQWRAWVPPRFRSHGLKTYYEVGVVTQRLAFGYDLIANQLSAEEKRGVIQAFWKQAIAPVVEEYFLFNRDPIGASNWMANSIGGALAAAVAVAGDAPEWDRQEAPAIAELEFAFEQLLKGLFPGDGSEAEPLGYENFAMQGISWGMSSLQALQIRPMLAEQMIRGFWWPYYATVRPGMQLDTGDFNGHLTKLPGFAWPAEHAGIPELRALYDSEAQPDLSRGVSLGENGHLLEEMPGPLDLACCSEAAVSFKPPPVSRIFPERGSAVLRSGWQPESTVISLRAGPWFNHEHHDEGSFQVAAFGQKLIDEAGYANYYTDPHYPDYFTQAAGHNTLLVDGDPFSQTAFNARFWAAFPHPYFRSQLLTSDFDYLNVDLTAAYDGALESYKREFFFVKPNILVVRDTVQAPQARTFSWLLHAPAGSNLTTDAAHALIATKKAGASVIALGPNSRWLTSTTPLQVTQFDDLDRQHIEPRRELLLNSSKTSRTQFLVGMNFTASADDAGRMESWSSAAGEGFRTADHSGFTAIFRTKPGLLSIARLASDGSVLLKRESASQQAASSVEAADWSAIGATFVREGEQTLFRSDTAVDVAAENLASGMQLTVHNNSGAGINIFRGEAPEGLEIDGHRIPIRYEQMLLKLPSLPPGEHHVSIY